MRVSALLYLSTITLCLGLTTEANGRTCAEIDELFAKADANADDTLTRTEIEDFRHQAFARLDRNGDGRAESKDAPPPFRKRYNQQLTPLLERFDGNRDNSLSRDEFVNGATPAFDAADSDGNGQVDATERRAGC
jgi:Ca2+-binding EF-hand superfamily protein